MSQTDTENVPLRLLLLKQFTKDNLHKPITEIEPKFKEFFPDGTMSHSNRVTTFNIPEGWLEVAGTNTVEGTL